MAPLQMSAELLRQIDPIKHERVFLSKGVRSDGRDSFDQVRSEHVVTNVIGSAIGSASCRIGETSVIVGITAGVFSLPEGVVRREPLVGKLSVSCDYSLAIPGERRIAQNAAACLSHKIETVLKNENVFDVAQLAVQFEPEQEAFPLISVEDAADGADDEQVSDIRSVWDVTVNVTIVKDSGAVFDSALMAAVAAIKTTLLPVLTKKLTVSETVTDKTALKFKSIPVPFTFALVGDLWLLDPSRSEEDVLPQLTLAIADGKIVQLSGLELPRLPQATTSGLPGFKLSDIESKLLPVMKSHIPQRTNAMNSAKPSL